MSEHSDHVEQHTHVCPKCGEARTGPAVPIRADGPTIIWVCHSCHSNFEISHLFTEVGSKPPAARQLRVENARLAKDVRRLEQWVSDLQGRYYVNCVYCGHRYGPATSTPVSMHEMLYTHIANCPRHPLSHALAQVAQLETINTFLVPTGISEYYSVCVTREEALRMARERRIQYVRPMHEFPKLLVEYDQEAHAS